MKVLVSSVEGNRQWLDGGAMFGNAPRAMWEKWIEPDEIGRIPLACRTVLVEIDNKKILCETGIGAFFEPKLAQRFGVQNPDRHLLLENLKQLGVAPEEIDYVILSHLHFDHAGGLLPTYQQLESGKKDIVFSNAKFVVGKEAWERAQNPHFRDRASFIPGLNKQLKDSHRMVVLEGSSFSELPYLEFFLSHGHTPGQLHTIVHGTNKDLVFCGDLVPGTSWIHIPITMGYDRFAELLIDEKKSLYERMNLENTIFFFTHDSSFAAATIEFNKDKKRYLAKEVFDTLNRFSI